MTSSLLAYAISITPHPRHPLQTPPPILSRTLSRRSPPPLRRARARIHASGQWNENDDGRAAATAAAAARSRHNESQDSYLQCVECAALYMVEPEELEGAPRVVGCSACLHEWYACEDDLLWGEEDALAALASEGSFEDQALRERDAASRKAVAAAQGILTREQGEGRRREEEEDGRGVGVIREVKKGFVPRGAKRKGAGEEKRVGGKAEEGGVMRERQSAQLTEREKGDSAEEGVEEKKQNGKDRETNEHFNVFVGNLSFRASEEDLYRAFSGYGVVTRCQVPLDASGASKGFGFVEMRTRAAGKLAIEKLQGTSILGRDVSLNEARPRKEAPTNARRHYKGGSQGKDGRRSRSA